MPYHGHHARSADLHLTKKGLVRIRHNSVTSAWIVLKPMPINKPDVFRRFGLIRNGFRD